MGGEKIDNSNIAVRDMLDEFRGNETSETEIWVSITRLGEKVAASAYDQRPKPFTGGRRHDPVGCRA